MAKKKSNAGKFILGAAVGAALGILFAPKSGKETRAALKKKAGELIEKAKEIDVKEVRDEIEDKVSSIIEEMKDLDKKKATPVVEEAAEALREKAIDATKKVLEKLESK